MTIAAYVAQMAPGLHRRVDRGKNSQSAFYRVSITGKYREMRNILKYNLQCD
jgi:hypothetical protein